MGKIRIKATFLDEISTDIPHQNWGYEEWARDFEAMRAVGIDTVVLIRCGLEKFIAYPSEILMKERGAYRPPVDLVEMFLDLADKNAMRFFFGTYVGQRKWYGEEVDFRAECAFDQRIAEEAWKRYNRHPSFKGWYLSKEISTYREGVVEEFVELGKFCKELSGDLPVLISPGMKGRKAWQNGDPAAHDLDFEKHLADWDRIMGRISGVVDIIAFQDGHLIYEELPEALRINKSLADKHGIESWTNTESFDRDMPWRFPPIKWEKMLLKLRAAESVGIERAMTFEFSHFMSPNSMWPSAHGLYKRYREYLRGDFDR